jgi:hypothetical protein
MLSVEEAAILFREARLGCLHTEGHTEARADEAAAWRAMVKAAGY